MLATKKHTQHVPSMKMECDFLNGRIKNNNNNNKKKTPVTYTKMSPKIVNPRDIACNSEEEEYPRTLCNQSLIFFNMAVTLVSTKMYCIRNLLLLVLMSEVHHLNLTVVLPDTKSDITDNFNIKSQYCSKAQLIIRKMLISIV